MQLINAHRHKRYLQLRAYKILPLLFINFKRRLNIVGIHIPVVILTAGYP